MNRADNFCLFIDVGRGRDFLSWQAATCFEYKLLRAVLQVSFESWHLIVTCLKQFGSFRSLQR